MILAAKEKARLDRKRLVNVEALGDDQFAVGQRKSAIRSPSLAWPHVAMAFG